MIDPSRDDQIVARIDAGARAPVVASELGLSRERVRQVYSRKTGHGLPRPAPVVPVSGDPSREDRTAEYAARDARVIAMARHGASTDDMAVSFRMSPSNVRRILYKHGFAGDRTGPGARWVQRGY